MRAAIKEGDMVSAMLFASAYVFLARVPSELLTWSVDGKGLTDRKRVCTSVAVQWDDKELRVHLCKRKNARWGDTIRRSCSCSLSEALCPVHTIVPWLREHSRGARPFGKLSAVQATKKLRHYLTICGVDEPSKYTLHCFRRGAAQDYVEFGCTLQELLIAGGWSSRACFVYLRPKDMNVHNVAKFVVDNSDSEDE